MFLPQNRAARSRRHFLTVGALGGLGLSLADVLRWETRAEIKQFDHREGAAKSVIHVFLPGGIAHQESFDPKPLSPVAYRGTTQSIDTKLPGIQFSHHLPKLAERNDQFTLCRAVTHVLADHDAGVHQMFTGYAPSPVLRYPSQGSVVSHEFGARGDLPPYICIPDKPNNFAGSGYLSSAHGPFSLGSDPGASGFVVRDLVPPSEITAQRTQRARRILRRINRRIERQPAAPLAAIDAFYEQAYRLVTSQRARAAFDLSAEPPAVQESYGSSAAGRRLLVARRLVEAGARFVSLTYGSWDDHFNIAPSIGGQLPAFDHAFAALLGDLIQRDLFDSTLVVVTTEFGRTPKINSSAGRDHWSRVFSVLLAGGGIRRGLVHGSSNLTAAEPETGAMSAQDLLTTIYHLIGIVAGKELMAPGERPVEIVKNGRVIQELLA